jgi:N-acetylmuramoyl-L-alanine amidase
VRPIHTIIVHCSATPPDWMEGQGVEAQLAEIRRWHLARGWRREGYHFLIGRDGQIAKGRPVEEVGAHVKGHNIGSIGVCLVGGKWPQGAWGVKTDKFSDHFTPEQDRALRRLLTDLCEQFPSIKHIRGHNDYTDSKGCPSFTVSDWLKAEPTVTSTPKANWGIAGLIVLAFAWLIGRKK